MPRRNDAFSQLSFVHINTVSACQEKKEKFFFIEATNFDNLT